MRVICEPDLVLGNALTVQPAGRLDAYGATQFWEAVGERVTEDNPFLLIDMEGVEILSSAGVGTLIRLLTRTQQFHGSLSAYNANSRVRSVLEVVNLTSVVNLKETVEAARERLRELGAE
jgi:anti-anti-sigma factor